MTTKNTTIPQSVIDELAKADGYRGCMSVHRKSVSAEAATALAFEVAIRRSTGGDSLTDNMVANLAILDGIDPPDDVRIKAAKRIAVAAIIAVQKLEEKESLA